MTPWAPDRLADRQTHPRDAAPGDHGPERGRAGLGSPAFVFPGVVALETGKVDTEKFGRLDEKMNTVKDNIDSLKLDFRDLKEDLRRGTIRGKS